MLVVETIAKIRRAYFVQGKPIKAICRELSIAEGRPQGDPVRGDGVPLRAETQPLPKIGPWTAELDRLLGRTRASRRGNG